MHMMQIFGVEFITGIFAENYIRLNESLGAAYQDIGFYNRRLDMHSGHGIVANLLQISN